MAELKVVKTESPSLDAMDGPALQHVETPPLDEMDGPAFQHVENGMIVPRPRQRREPADEMTVEPLLKRVRLTEKADKYCWFCHKDGGPMVACDLCPRSFHCKCVALPDVVKLLQWICYECENIMRAESEATRSKSMASMQRDGLHSLLAYALERMQSAAVDAFHHPVNVEQVPQYEDFIVYPCDLSTLEQNIERKVYGCTEGFTADAKWIVHNCIIFNGTHHNLTTSAKTMLKICKHEMSEIEVCPDCYRNSCAKQKDSDWFCLPCKNPHRLVWAKLKGYPFWPAKALRELDDEVDVRFFGAHDRAWVPVSQVYSLSLECPAPAKGRRGGFDEAMRELDLHVQKLRVTLGQYDYAPFKTPYRLTTEAGESAEGAGTLSAASTGLQRSQQSNSRKRSHLRKSDTFKRIRLTQQPSITASARTSAAVPGRASAAAATASPPRTQRSSGALTAVSPTRSSRTPRLASKHHLFIRHPHGGAGDADTSGAGASDPDPSGAGASDPDTSGAGASDPDTSGAGGGDACRPDGGEDDVDASGADGGDADASSDNSGSSSSLSSVSHASLTSQPTDAGSPNDSPAAISSIQQAMPGTPALALTQPEEAACGAFSRATKTGGAAANTVDTVDDKHCQAADIVPASPCPATAGKPESSPPGGLGIGGGERLSRSPEMPKLVLFSAERSGGIELAPILSDLPAYAPSSSSLPAALTDKPVGDATDVAPLGDVTAEGVANPRAEQRGRADSVATEELHVAGNTTEGEQQHTAIETDARALPPTLDANHHVNGESIGDIEQVASAMQSHNANSMHTRGGSLPASDAFFENLAQTIETCKAQLGLSDAQPSDQPDDDISESDDDGSRSSGNKLNMDRRECELDGHSSPVGQAVSFSGDGKSDRSSSGTIICSSCFKPSYSDRGSGTSNGNLCQACSIGDRIVVPPRGKVDMTTNSLVPAGHSSSIAKATTERITGQVTAARDLRAIRSKDSLIRADANLQRENASSRSESATAVSSVVSAETAPASDRSAGVTDNNYKLSFQWAATPSSSTTSVANKSDSGMTTLPVVHVGYSTRSMPAVRSLVSKTQLVSSRVSASTPQSRAPYSRPPAHWGPAGAASGVPSVRTAEEELAQLRLWHINEVAEFKHGRELMISEIKRMSELEKRRALAKAKKQADEQLSWTVKETKSKQWCANCHREASLYCCWNTSYCDYPCQTLHWTQHMPVCNHDKLEALDGTNEGDGDDSEEIGSITSAVTVAPVATLPSTSACNQAVSGSVLQPQSAPLTVQQQATTLLNGNRIAEQKQAPSTVAVTQRVSDDQWGYSHSKAYTVGDGLQLQSVGAAVTATMATAPPSSTSNAASTRQPSSKLRMVVDGQSSFATLRQQPPVSTGTMATPGRNGNPSVGTTMLRYQLSAAAGVARSSSGEAVVTGGVPRQQATSAGGLPVSVAVVRNRAATPSRVVLRQQTSAAVAQATRANGTIPAPFFRSPASAQSGAGQQSRSTHQGTGGQPSPRKSAQ